MNEKIRFSEFFTRTWALFSGRYRALLAPILTTILPATILSGALGLSSVFFTSHMATTSASSAGADAFVYSMLVMAASLLIVALSVLVVVPASYAIYIILLYPGVSGMGAMRQAFGNYGKSLGNMLFSSLPQFVAMIPITIIAVIISVFLGFYAVATAAAAIAPIIAVFVIIILGIVLAMSAVYAFFAQMIPLSLMENIPITSTLMMAARRAKGTVLSYMSLMMIYYVIMLVPTLGIGFLQAYSMEGYVALYMLLMIGTAFLSPIVYAMNTASYQLQKDARRLEA